MTSTRTRTKGQQTTLNSCPAVSSRLAIRETRVSRVGWRLPRRGLSAAYGLSWTPPIRRGERPLHFKRASATAEAARTASTRRNRGRRDLRHAAGTAAGTCENGSTSRNTRERRAACSGRAERNARDVPGGLPC
ncbi:hypothetical protein OH77DRAFT_120920 [Trametes cingulata]|nr:hypothetical protein OH77DRAFT_120920 [Trametes cingulata]